MPDASYLRRVGYTFLGWSRKLGATEPDADLTYQDLDGDGIYETAPTGWRMPAEETILYAVWEAQWIPIIYDSNYPDVPHLDPDEWLVECSTTITLDAPQRDGYKLKGWAVTPDATDIDYKPGDKYDVLNWLSVLEDNGDGTFSEKLVNPNVLYAIWEPDGVTIDFWSFTDADEINMQIVHTITVMLTDIFDPTYDQNKDADPNNDWLPYRAIGWSDDELNTYWVDDPADTWPTIQQLIDNAFPDPAFPWDGTSHINLYCEFDLRVFDVHYIMYGYEDEYFFEIDQQFDWFSCPVDTSFTWQGHSLDDVLDEEFNSLDNTMTCGDIWLQLNYDYPVLYYPNDELYIEYVWTTFDYTVTLYYPNGITEVLSLLYVDGINFPTGGDGFDYPGYDFVGWFTQPNGAGDQIIDGRQYSDITHDDTIQNIDLYAYFVPSVGGSSVTSMSVLDEVVNSIQTASESAPASSAAPAMRSLASATQVASKPQNAVTAALQLASAQTVTPSALADAAYVAPASALAASDAMLAPSFYPVATNATCTYEAIAKSTARTTVCPAQTVQSAFVGSKRREA